jgi:hypothetical protein
VAGSKLTISASRFVPTFQNTLTVTHTHTHIQQTHIHTHTHTHRHGLGVLKFADGVTYQGEWSHDLPDGYGVEIYPDGSIYKGSHVP